MLKPNQSKTWYGMLETSQSRTPVVYEPKLPSPPTGQIYLFNLERGEVLPYQWSIVQERLRDLPSDQESAVKAEVAAPLREAIKAFLAKSQDRHHLSTSSMSRQRNTASREASADAFADHDLLDDILFE
jgi:hypothetical protein